MDVKEQLLKSEKKLEVLDEWYRRFPKLLIALSGGVDSCVVAYTARKILGKDNAVAVISHSASLKSRDFSDAKKFCELYDIHLEVINAREIENENYAANPDNRCYFCKNSLYEMMGTLIEKKYAGYVIANGTNSDDLSDYRPGLQAADEHRVMSPLAECKMSKKDIREIARHLNLFVWDKPASPCLSSRFPYGEQIDWDKLKMVEAAEEVLFSLGFKESRVRHRGNNARIEVRKEQVRSLESSFEDIKEAFARIGYERCEIDPEGFVSGKLNRNLHG